VLHGEVGTCLDDNCDVLSETPDRGEDWDKDVITGSEEDDDDDDMSG
jgi:hypothetical protein